MEEMMEEEEYQASDTNKNISGTPGGYRRSWSNPGPEPDMNRPNTLRLCSGIRVLVFTLSPQNVTMQCTKYKI